jgi:hypothetical protein
MPKFNPSRKPTKVSPLTRSFVCVLLAATAFPCAVFAGPGWTRKPIYTRPMTPSTRSIAPQRTLSTYTRRAPRQQPTKSRPPLSNTMKFNTARRPPIAPTFKSAAGVDSAPKPTDGPAGTGLSKTVAAIRNKYAMAATNNNPIKLRNKLSFPPGKLAPALTPKPPKMGGGPELGTWEGMNVSGYTPSAHASEIREKTIVISSESRYLSAKFHKARDETAGYKSPLSDQERARLKQQISDLDEPK